MYIFAFWSKSQCITSTPLIPTIKNTLQELQKQPDRNGRKALDLFFPHKNILWAREKDNQLYHSSEKLN